MMWNDGDTQYHGARPIGLKQSRPAPWRHGRRGAGSPKNSEHSHKRNAHGTRHQLVGGVTYRAARPTQAHALGGVGRGFTTTCSIGITVVEISSTDM
jgi:hypothetical protein